MDHPAVVTEITHTTISLRDAGECLPKIILGEGVTVSDLLEEPQPCPHHRSGLERPPVRLVRATRSRIVHRCSICVTMPPPRRLGECVPVSVADCNDSSAQGWPSRRG